MNIGFDAKRLFGNFTGLGNYSRTLVKNLADFHPENAYTLFTPKLSNSPETDFFNNPEKFKNYVTDSKLKSYWRSFSITKQLEKDNIDIYHGLSNEVPFNIAKSKVKSIVTIHDLIFKTLPATYPLIDKTIYDLKFKSSCNNADKIIAISESTKTDIVNYYNIAPEKIEVIYQSCNALFYTPIDDSENGSLLQKYNLPNEFLLYVGSVEKRKNLKNIVRGLSILSSENKIPLVVVGGTKDKDYKKEIDELIITNKLDNDVIWIHDLKDNQGLKQLYHRAKALVYPSFYEGFGLPVAEALLSKLPTITSNVSSLPEAGGPNSIFVNPDSYEEIAEAISQILDDESLRTKMIETGYEFAINSFSPKVTAGHLNAFYTKLHNS